MSVTARAAARRGIFGDGFVVLTCTHLHTLPAPPPAALERGQDREVRAATLLGGVCVKGALLML